MLMAGIGACLIAGLSLRSIGPIFFVTYLLCYLFGRFIYVCIDTHSVVKDTIFLYVGQSGVGIFESESSFGEISRVGKTDKILRIRLLATWSYQYIPC